MSDDAFVEAILASPEDHSLRLIYADWLEERGDLRGELLRIEHEMRGLPIASRRYWELKPRRSELRERCDREWLRRVFGEGGCGVEFVFLTFPEVEGAVIRWDYSAAKSPELVEAALAAGFTEWEVRGSPLGTLVEDFPACPTPMVWRGARALIGMNGSTLVEVR
jgi:uncharacterized protein (TIGR02996 family)